MLRRPLPIPDPSMNLVLLVSALATPAWADPCAVPVSEFSARVDAAEQAYADFEVQAFSASMDEAALMLPCLNAVVTNGVAAHYLRMVGLQQYVGHDTVKAEALFGAARSLDAAYQFPDSLIPTGHAIRTHYGAVDVSILPWTPIGAPRTGSVMFNGVPVSATAPERPGWPAIVQVVDKDSLVTATALVYPTQSLPPYDALPLPVSAVAGVERHPMNPKIPVGIATGLAAIASGTLYGLASGSAADFHTYRADDTVDALTARQKKTNGLVYASVATGVLAVAGGVGVVLVGKW